MLLTNLRLFSVLFFELSSFIPCLPRPPEANLSTAAKSLRGRRRLLQIDSVGNRFMTQPGNSLTILLLSLARSIKQGSRVFKSLIVLSNRHSGEIPTFLFP